MVTSRLSEANHGGFFGTRLGLIDDISALKNQNMAKLVTTWTSAANHDEAHYYQWTMLALPRSQFSMGFWSRFFVGFRDSEKEEGLR